MSMLSVEDQTCRKTVSCQKTQKSALWLLWEAPGRIRTGLALFHKENDCMYQVVNFWTDFPLTGILCHLEDNSKIPKKQTNTNTVTSNCACCSWQSHCKTRKFRKRLTFVNFVNWANLRKFVFTNLRIFVFTKRLFHSYFDRWKTQIYEN